VLGEGGGPPRDVVRRPVGTDSEGDHALDFLDRRATQQGSKTRHLVGPTRGFGRTVEHVDEICQEH